MRHVVQDHHQGRNSKIKPRNGAIVAGVHLQAKDNLEGGYAPLPSETLIADKLRTEEKSSAKQHLP